MSEILVKTNIMTQCVSSEQAMMKKLNSLAGEIERVQRNLSFNVKSRARISSQLSSLSKVTQRNADRMSSLASVLSNAAGTYSSTEKRISGNVSSSAVRKSKSKETAKSGNTNSDTGWDWEKIRKKLFSVIGTFGAAGGFSSLINSIISENPIDIGKGLLKLIGPGAKAAGKMIGKSDVKWKEILFGMGEKVVKKGFSANWAEQLDGFKFYSKTAADATTHNLGAIAKWGGAALTAVGSFADNYKEFKGDFSNPRMYAETVVETGVSVFGTMATISTTGAALALIPGVGVPAWAATVIGTAIYTGGDWLVEKFTGQGIGEWAADGAVWVGEKAIDGLSWAGEQIVDFGKGAANAVSNAGKWVGDKVGGIGKTVAGWFK